MKKVEALTILGTLLLNLKKISVVVLIYTSKPKTIIEMTNTIDLLILAGRS